MDGISCTKRQFTFGAGWGRAEGNSTRFHHGNKNREQFKTSELFISSILIFLDCHWPQVTETADEPSGTPKRNGFILPSALLGRGYIICSSTIINKSLYTLPTEKNFISQKQLWQILLRQHSLGNTTQYPAPKPWLTHFRNDSNYQKNSIKTWGLSNPLIGLEFIY